MLEEAERYLIRRLEQIRQASVYGIRPKRTFQEAATKYLMEHQHKASLHVDAGNIRILDKFIGGLPLDGIHMGTLQSYIGVRRKEGVKTRTINHGLQIVRRILNLAASEWLDEYGLTWIAIAPKIRLFSELDRQQPYPLDRQEQARLFNELPVHLRRMALFAVNTGCRDYVFTYLGKPTTRMLNSAWLKARARSGLPKVRVHDLKHTFGRRLRAAGESSRMTTHYSQAELNNLIHAANKVCGIGQGVPLLTVLKRSM